MFKFNSFNGSGSSPAPSGDILNNNGITSNDNNSNSNSNNMAEMNIHIPTRLMNLTTVLPRTTLTNRKRQSLPLSYAPSEFDVCCGRGKRNWNHAGNVSFRKLVQANVERYINAPTKNDKTAVVISLVDEIRAQGGHFLKQNVAGFWFDIGDQQAREKVGHSLRDQVSSLSRQKNKQQAIIMQNTPGHNISPVPPPPQAPPQPQPLIQPLAFQRQVQVQEAPVIAQYEIPVETDMDNSDTHSDSGKDREVRRATLSSSMIMDAFQRRPSFLSLSINSSDLNGVLKDSITSLGGGSLGGNSMSNRTSLKFMEGLDLEELYNEQLVGGDPVLSQAAV